MSAPYRVPSGFTGDNFREAVSEPGRRMPRPAKALLPKQQQFGWYKKLCAGGYSMRRLHGPQQTFDYISPYSMESGMPHPGIHLLIGPFPHVPLSPPFSAISGVGFPSSSPFPLLQSLRDALREWGRCTRRSLAAR